MIDPKLFRDDFESVKKALLSKGVNQSDLDQYVKLDKQWREFKIELEQNISKNLVIYDKDHTFMDTKSNNTKVLTYYDDYNDNKASERIINYLENNEKN